MVFKRSQMSNKEREKEISEKEIEATLFVPYTPGSELCKIIQETDDEFVLGTRYKRIKVVERVGPTLEQILCKPSPWKFQGCTRNECFPCQHGGGAGGDCQREGVTYTIHCLECRKAGRDVEYVGETSRTTFERGSQHVNDLENEVSGKPLWEHVKEDHGGI